MSAMSSLNRVVGAIVALQAEREKLQTLNPIPPHLAGLLAEIKHTAPRWLTTLDKVREDMSEPEVTLFDDVALNARR